MSGVDDADAKVAALIEALLPDDEGQDDENLASDLGIDMAALSSSLEARVRDFRVREKEARYAQIEAARRAELDRLVGQLPLPEMTQDERLSMATALLEQAGPEGAGLYFMKFEEATEAELDEAIRTLRHLLAERDEES
jgi:hypothetical protein